MHKVRPLIDMIKHRCQKYAVMTKSANIDQSMIPHYGKAGQKPKQRIPLKPIRSGYKVWSLNLQGGCLYNFEVYQGKGSKNEFADNFGLGPTIVICLVKSLPKGNFSIFIDNCFNSIPLMKYLRDKNIGCTATVKGNMLGDCPLPTKSEFKKQGKLPRVSGGKHWCRDCDVE